MARRLRRHLGCVMVAMVALSTVACAPRERTVELSAIDQRQGYRYLSLEQKAPKRLSDSYVVATFSGGGTRAAALADGVLRALGETVIPLRGGETRLADEIDLISSVSGGSVASAYFGLNGRSGLPEFERNFLKRDVQSSLILTALNPVTWFRLATPSYNRIDALRDYLDANVFNGATYADLLARQNATERRPYVVLNAADMSTGTVFSFTQDQFDLICADLTQLKLADGVSASAAFPVALSALTLKNRAPCAAQQAAIGNPAASWAAGPDGHPRPLRVVNDLADQAGNPGRYRRGRIAVHYLNEQGQTGYVQLLDGGIADNLGLSEPLSQLTSLDRVPSILGRINRGQIKRLAVFLVNARSEPDTSYSTRATPPGTLSTLLTTIGTPIDSTSFSLLDQLDKITSEGSPKLVRSVVPIDFDFIQDDACRRAFKNIETSWALSDREVDALIAMGGALVRDSKAFRAFVADLGGSIGGGSSIDQACRVLLTTN